MSKVSWLSISSEDPFELKTSRAKIGKIDFYVMNENIEEVSIFFSKLASVACNQINNEITVHELNTFGMELVTKILLAQVAVSDFG